MEKTYLTGKALDKEIISVTTDFISIGLRLHVAAMSVLKHACEHDASKTNNFYVRLDDGHKALFKAWANVHAGFGTEGSSRKHWLGFDDKKGGFYVKSGAEFKSARDETGQRLDEIYDLPSFLKRTPRASDFVQTLSMSSVAAFLKRTIEQAEKNDDEASRVPVFSPRDIGLLKGLYAEVQPVAEKMDKLLGQKPTEAVVAAAKARIAEEQAPKATAPAKLIKAKGRAPADAVAAQ